MDLCREKARRDSLFAGHEGLGDILQSVLHRVPEGRSLGLMADLSEDVALSILGDDFHAHTPVGHPAPPGPGGAVGLPRFEYIALEHEIASGLDDLEPLLIEPFLHVVLAVAGGLPDFRAL